MTYFSHEKNINILSDENQIVFSHKFTSSDSEEHKLHINQYYEIYIFISGDADYIVKGSCYQLQKGDIIVISPYEVHSVIIKSSCDYERFYCLIPANSFHSLQIDPLQGFERKYSSGHNLLRLSPEKKKLILSQLYKMSEMSKMGGATAEMMTFGVFLEFLSTIIFEKGTDSDYAKSVAYTNTSSIVSDALAYMEKNFAIIENVSEVSDYLNVTHPYLSSTFKKNTGVSMKQYLQHLRIARAKRLLEENHSVTDVCFESGFNDCSHFIKIFKETLGVTPYKYKKSCHFQK